MDQTEYIVKKIDKNKSEKCAFNAAKWTLRANQGFLYYTAIVMSPSGLGLPIVLVGVGLLLHQFTKKMADRSWERTVENDQLKNKITKEEYKMYHVSLRPVQKVKKVISNIKSIIHDNGYAKKM